MKNYGNSKLLVNKKIAAIY